MKLGGPACFVCDETSTREVSSRLFDLSVACCSSCGESIAGLLLVLEKRIPAGEPEQFDGDRAEAYRAHAASYAADAREAVSDLLGVSSSDSVLALLVESIVFAAEASTMARLVELRKA